MSVTQEPVSSKGQISVFFKKLVNKTQMLLYPQIWCRKCPGLGNTSLKNVILLIP